MQVTGFGMFSSDSAAAAHTTTKVGSARKTQQRESPKQQKLERDREVHLGALSGLTFKGKEGGKCPTQAMPSNKEFVTWMFLHEFHHLRDDAFVFGLETTILSFLSTGCLVKQVTCFFFHGKKHHFTHTRHGLCVSLATLTVKATMDTNSLGLALDTLLMEWIGDPIHHDLNILNKVLIGDTSTETNRHSLSLT